MEFDPVARDVPPARHALESDSEESENGGVDAGAEAQQEHLSSRPPHVEIRPSTHASQKAAQGGGPLVMFLGHAGEASVRAMCAPEKSRNASGESAQWTEDAALIVNDEQQGSLCWATTSSPCTVALLQPNSALGPSDFAWIGAALLHALRPSAVILIDQYAVSLYLSTQQEAVDQHEAPIRFLHAAKPALQPTSHTRPFEAPNYATGLAASLLTEAHIYNLPATLLLLPLQQPHVNPHLQALQHVQPHLSSASHAGPQPAPLPEHLHQPLSQQLPPSIWTLRQANAAPLDAFVQRQRTSARKHVAHTTAAMYM